MTQPRMARAAKLREYLDLPEAASLAVIPVRPVRIGNSDRWDLRAIDAWLDGLSGNGASYAPSAPAASNEDDPDAILQGWLKDRGGKRETSGRA